MKRIVSLIMVFAMFFSLLTFAYAEEDTMFEIDASIVDMTSTKKTEDVYIRDPCILVYGGKYFMYGTGVATVPGYGCYVSEDLENWAGPVNVFEASKNEGFDGIDNYWAPECYYYNGSFWIFATYKSGTTGHRGVSVLKSDSPLGPFVEITDGHITPHEWDSIDGTLYIDQNNEPWMIFVHEWTSMPDGIGDMSCAKLSEDLTNFTTEPVTMFKANEPLWSTGHVTDGPFPYRTSNGDLIMLWSNGVSGDGYGVGIARSSNGEIDGEWTQDEIPLYHANNYHELDGGHGMIFTALDGRMMLSIHSPNGGEIMTHAVFIELEDTGDSVQIKGEHGTVKNWFENIWKIIRFAFEKVIDFFEKLFS